jgi:leucyl/phenylalanyl-tRNA--protein transferase
MNPPPPLALLRPGEPFPPVEQAWPAGSPAPGLLAAGGALDVGTLLAAYSAAIFPWFSRGEPILWWSPDPRMALDARGFCLHRSLRQSIRRFRADPACRIRMDSAFGQVIAACAQAPRRGQRGTWIVPEMQRAYGALHAAGHAHSVEVWVGERLAAGLYLVAIGRAVFGESMFTQINDGSKIALAALVAFARAHGIELIDCQQNTPHLAFMGAAEMPRAQFARRVAALAALPPPPRWRFEHVYWDALLPPPSPSR